MLDYGQAESAGGDPFTAIFIVVCIVVMVLILNDLFGG